MFDQLALLLGQFNELSRANPMLATVLGAGGATALVMSLRRIPAKIWGFFFGQITTTLTMNNSGWDGGSDQFRSFMLWYIKHSWSRWSRNLSLETQYRSKGDNLVALGAGFGTHYFWYRHRLFWFRKTKLDSSGTTLEKYEITIRGFTRDRSIFEAMLDEFRHRSSENTITVTAWAYDKWGEPVAVTKRNLDTVVLEAKLKASLLKQIDWFYASRQWFEDRGLPYKRCVLFYGPPGTGKTSIIKALASHYGRNVYTINLSCISDNMLTQAMASIPVGSIVLIEDFDTNNTVLRRESIPQPVINQEIADAPAAPGALTPATPRVQGSLTLSGLLNTLDGIVPLDGSLVFMTTNHLENIDPALIRKGRVDSMVKIPLLSHTEVCTYIDLMFPGTVIDRKIAFRDIAGCDLMALFTESYDDATAFIKSIPQTSVSEALAEGVCHQLIRDEALRKTA